MSKGRVSVQPGQISDKWNKNLKSAVPYIQQGIDNMQVSPTEEAAKKQDKMLQNVQEAVSSGRWATALRGVSKADWQAVTKKKVASRLAGGVDEAMPKRQKFDTYLVNTLNGILPGIAAMPDMTLDDSKARVIALIDGMAANPYKK